MWVSFLLVSVYNTSMKWAGDISQVGELSRFWLRRLCEAALFVGLVIVLLYSWARFIPTGYRLPIGEAITDLAAAISALVSLAALILCLWLPRRAITAASIAVYGLIILAVGSLVATSGFLASPFAAAWLSAAVFAGFFGWPVVLGISLLVVTAITTAAITQHASPIATIGALFFGLAPLALGFIIWRHQPRVSKLGDISELRTKLSTAEGTSDIVINTIDDGVLAISREGNIELINPSAQRIIGWNQGDALGLKWQSVIQLVTADGKDVTVTENPVMQSLINNRPAHSDKLLLRTASDKQILVSIVASPVGKDNEGIIVVFRDITKEKAEERQQAEFISTASHEMRTPVASIEGYLGLALNPATAHIDDKARDFITKAHASAQHLGRLFQDLLDISRAEDGRLKNEPQIINITTFVGEIFEGLAPRAAEKGLVCTFRPDAAATVQPAYYANVDADHLREVVSNLIENAIKYTPDGEVVVDITGDDKTITISVQDSGIGIPAEDVPHLFQKFYRVDNSDTREIGGTGLGLYLSRRLTEAMSGRLFVISEYRKGSTFFLEIPRTRTDEAMRQLPTVPTPAAPPLTAEPPTAVAVQPTVPINATQPDAADTVLTKPATPPVPPPNFSPLPLMPAPPTEPTAPAPAMPSTPPDPTPEPLATPTPPEPTATPTPSAPLATPEPDAAQQKP